MRFLADENLSLSTVEALRGLGHDVAWIRTDAPESADEQVLARAAAERRVLITADDDSAEIRAGRVRAASTAAGESAISGTG